MNEILKQHNDFIDLPLRKFNASEIDILNALCYECQNKETKEIILTFNKIKDLAYYKGKDTRQFVSDLKRTNQKLMSLNFTIVNEEKTEITQFVLFPTFTINLDDEVITVQVHEKFAYLLNSLQNCYTSLEIRESAKLKSAYSKGIYKKLREYKNTDKPFWKVSMEDFREYLDIPKNFTSSKIDQRIINIAIKELSPFFTDLEVEKYMAKNKEKRGRPKIAGYIFKFTAKAKPKISKKDIAEIAKLTGWKKIGKYCPVCKQEVYEKRLKNINGEYIILGHPDFSTGICKRIFYEYSDLISKRDIEKEKRAKEDGEKEITDEELKENRERLSEMLDSLFCC